MPVNLAPLVCRFVPELQSSLCPRTNQQAPCALMDHSYILSKLQTHENHQFVLEEKRKLAGFFSVSHNAIDNNFFFVHSPAPPESLESSNYNHWRIHSEQTVFKKINVCVCVYVLFLFQWRKKKAIHKKIPQIAFEKCWTPPPQPLFTNHIMLFDNSSCFLKVLLPDYGETHQTEAHMHLNDVLFMVSFQEKQ